MPSHCESSLVAAAWACAERGKMRNRSMCGLCLVCYGYNGTTASLGKGIGRGKINQRSLLGLIPFRFHLILLPRIARATFFTVAPATPVACYTLFLA